MGAVMTREEYTKAVAERIKAALDGDKRNAAKHMAESIPDKQRKAKLMAELKQALGRN
jgi:hypothetical protein